MAQQNSPSGRAEDPFVEPPSQDPWRAFSYVVTGVLVYGLIGWGLDAWLGTDFLVGLGIVAGAVMGLSLTWRAFPAPPGPEQDGQKHQDKNQ